jgi:ELAV/HuD family splicing factor
MFTPFGEIENCRIIMDKLTGTSQGYGFVKYKTDDAAAKAIEIMNGQSVENKQLKVSLARPASPSIQQANLYVAGLPKHYTKADLEQMFLPYGALIEAKILLDPATGVSRGVGFVRFASKDQAQIAIDSLNNHVPLGAETPITVRFSDTREDKVRKGKSPSPAGFMGGVGRGMRFNPMAAPNAGAAASAYAPSAYGMYAQAPMAQDPLAAAAASGFGVYAQPAAAVAAPGLAYCLFIYNLPADGDESLLYRLFGPFGAISDVKVMRDTNGQCKGFGFVHYLKLEDAQQAIISMNGYQIGNKFLQVSFKKQK